MITVGLTGNPNCGKTTLFNKLTGSSEKVGNWPGVTIDRVEGFSRKNREIKIVDLPGVYSLSPYSPEENVTRDFLLDSDPDVVINVIDASNIERNLYLTLQILDLQLPTVIALNMIDVAESRNLKIDTKKLSAVIGCPVVTTNAVKGEGLDELIDAVSNAKKKANSITLSLDIETAITEISKLIKLDVPDHEKRWHATKILSRDSRTMEEHPELWNDAKPIIEKLEEKYDDLSDSIIAGGRYDVIVSIVKQCTVRGKEEQTRTDKIDSVVTNKWLGIPIFFVVLLGVYTLSVGTVGKACTEWIEGELVENIIKPNVETWLSGIGANDGIISLINDGIISGVGVVVSYLPQILILFLFISILEDCGYMARVCFIFDRIFRKFNLSGKSIIPLIVGTGCSVPGIMSANTIENESDRKLTIITTSFIPCSAKLPLIALIAGAVFGGSPLVAVFAYFLGIICVLVSGLVLKKLKRFTGEASVFVMELPHYSIPSAFSVAYNTADNGWQFVKRAGTMILVACVIIWALSHFSWNFSYISGESAVNDSILASIGKAITWIFVPLGWGSEWECTVATIAGLLTKENIIGTLEILLGDVNLIGTILSGPAALSFMSFNLICAPCFAAIGAMKKELGSWKTAGFAIAYQCVFAYAVSLMIFQFGELISSGSFGLGTVFAIAVAALLVYLIAAKNPFAPIEKALKK